VYNASFPITARDDLLLPPLYSIILPVYNGASYLQRTIESALGQTFSDFELLIADDQSSDNSYEIIQSFANRDKRITAWQNEKNLGLFANYNACLKKANGCLIKPFAQDDWFFPNLLEELKAVFETNENVVLVSCARRIIDADDQEIEVLRYFDHDTTRTYSEVLQDNLLTLKNLIGEPSSVAFRATSTGRGFDEIYHHLGDLEYWLRIIETGQYFFLNQVLCAFRQHAQSATARNARGLRFAIDMVHLGRQYASALAKFDITNDAFSRLITEVTASHVKYLLRRNGISLPDLSSSSENDSSASLERDLPALKEILFYSLMLAAEAKEEITALKEEREAERNKLENTIAKLLSSRSWKMTTPIRYLVRRGAAMMRPAPVNPPSS
jgi:glycosyltransferase involved in cell wall biosynthesis